MLLNVLDIVAKATVILGVAGLTAAALRRASASVRHFIWTLGMIGALAAPVVSFVVPRWELPIVRVNSGVSAVAAPFRGQTPDATPLGSDPSLSGSPSRAAEAVGSDPSLPVTHSRQLPLSSVSWTLLLLAAWAAGALLILGRVALGLVAVQWMSRRTPVVTDAPWLPLATDLAADLGLRRVRFMRAANASMPMAWGIFRPSVLMPADADGWPAERLQIVLLHELAHVKRRDCLTHVFAQMACAAYWFNPLAWIAAKHLRIERERACDDLVLAAGTRGSDYADQLLDIARVMRAGRFPAVLGGASLAMAHRSQLEGRLMAILDPTVPRRGLGRARGVLAAATFSLLILPVAAVQPWAQEAEPQPGPQIAAHHEDPPVVRTSVRQTVTKKQTTIARGHATAVPSSAARPAPVSGIVGGIVEGVVNGVVGGVAGGIADAAPSAQDAKDKTQKDKIKTDEKGSRDPRTVDALIEALKDTDSGVRETAMAALSHIHDPRVFEPFVLALRDSNPEVREQAVYGLGQLRDPRAIDPLTLALKDARADVREQAAFALGQLRAAAAIDPLTLALRDSNGDVREQAAFALGQIRDPRAADPLISALKDDDADVREQAAFALGQLRARTAVEALVVALKDSNASVREQVAFALGQLRDPRAIDGLTAALKDQTPSVRQQAAFALGQIRN